MTRKWLWMLGILTIAGPFAGQHRWLVPGGPTLATDGVPTGIALPNPGSGRTTLALAGDGSVWFSEPAGNRIAYLSFK